MGETGGLIDDSRVEVHVGIQLAADEVIVFERNAFQFDGGVELSRPFPSDAGH